MPINQALNPIAYSAHSQIHSELLLTVPLETGHWDIHFYQQCQLCSLYFLLLK